MLDARDITKRYGAVTANDHLSLAVRPGEVLGLFGENGAGKSTLLSILSGMVAPDGGEIVVDGTRVRFAGPDDAIRHGIGMVYQHFSLVPTFTVREQLRLAGWRATGLPDLLAGEMTGDERISSLSLGERQRVEIAKALIPNPRYLLLDEPTSILAPTEVDRLFALLGKIRDEGVGIVLVTHKLREAMALSDRVVVLRHGAVAGGATRPAGGWRPDTEADLLAAMFGDQPMIATAPAQTPTQTQTAPLPILAAHNVSSADGHRPVRDVTLTVGAGEICAIVGIDGQGQRELAEMLTGYRPATGAIRVRDRDLAGQPAPAFLRAGVGYLTDDRRGEGGVGTMSVALNLMLKRQRRARFSRRGLLRPRAIDADAREQVGEWDIRPPDVDLPLDVLSGGNMQKALLAREMALAPMVLVANKPTHGLDARTQDLVWRAMREITARDGGVLVLTTELDEALARADRVGVILHGRVSPLVPVAATDRMTVARMMVTGW